MEEKNRKKKTRHLEKDAGFICVFIEELYTDSCGTIAVNKNIILLSISLLYFYKELIYYIF